MAEKLKKPAVKATPKEVKFAVTLEDMAQRLNMTPVSLRDKCRRLGVEKHASGKYGWSVTDAKAAEAKLRAGARGNKKELVKKVNAKKPVASGAAAA
jgi:hypothetical protein